MQWVLNGISYDGSDLDFNEVLPEKLREDSEKLVIKKVANVPAKMLERRRRFLRENRFDFSAVVFNNNRCDR